MSVSGGKSGRRGNRRKPGSFISIQDLWAREAHENTDFTPSYIPEFITPEKYIDAKVKMLQEHMCIDLTDEDISHLYEYRTEGEINAAVKGIINKYWK